MSPLLLALILIVVGSLLQLYAPRHRLSVEERVKDRVMTPTEARRHQLFLRFSAPALMLLGVTLLGLGLYEMMA